MDARQPPTPADTQILNPQDSPVGRSAVLQLASKSAGRSNRMVVLIVFALLIGAYGLLWSTYWYPGSDSGLYIAVARSMSEGRGYTYMGRPHRMVPPLTPALLYAELQVSRSFGLMNALMIACMLGGFVFMYRTLRLWLDHRIALALMAASAASYWQFRLATTVGSDQPFFLLFWASLLCFARGCHLPLDQKLPAGKSFRSPAAWLTVGTALLLLGTGFRIAALLLVPVFVMALWMQCRPLLPNRARRLLLICAVGAPFVLAAGSYTIWGMLAKGPDGPREVVPLPVDSVPSTDADPLMASEDDSLHDAFQASGSHGQSVDRYCLTPRFALADIPLFPGLLGRWMAEAVVAPSREILAHLAKGWQALLMTGLTLLALVGLVHQSRAGHWWIVMPFVYILIIAYMWGFRLIPRYLTPILPMVILWIAIGSGQTAAALARWFKWSGDSPQRFARTVTMAVPILVIVANLPLLAVEVYARHHSDFYASTRQGAWAEIVDAAALVRRDLPDNIVICTNDPLLRREIHLLTGRAVAATNLPVNNPDDHEAVQRFFERTGARYAFIRYYDCNWPEWHLSLKRPHKKHAWWGIYEWDDRQGRPVRITPPVNREWVRSLPDASI